MPSPAPQELRQNPSPRRFAGRHPRTPRASPLRQGHPAASHRHRHARAPPCGGCTPRRASRCARCCRANSQACSCGRRMIRQSVSGLTIRSCAFFIKTRARSGAKPASTFADRALACAAPEVGPSQALESEPAAGSFVHDMFCIKLTWPGESIVSGDYVFHEQSQWDRRNLRCRAQIELRLRQRYSQREAENAPRRSASARCTASGTRRKNQAAAATFTAASASEVRVSSVFFSSCRVSSSSRTASLMPSCCAHCFSVP